MEVAELGRSMSVRIKRNWDYIKDNVMDEAVWEKYTQHPELEQLLLSTGDAILVEHTSRDSSWGDGGNGSGLNRLGKILMKIREELQEVKQ